MDSWAKIVLAFSLVTPAAAQQWVGVQAGMVNYAEGIFYINEEQLQFPNARFRELPKGESLRTGVGWVELQLGSGAFLWMGEEGMLRMEDPSLTNTKLLIERGSILVEVYEQTKTNKISLRSGDTVVELKDIGTYRIDSNPPQLRVYYGKAEMQAAGRKTIVRQGRAADLNRNPKMSRFDMKKTDPLQEKAARRSQLLAAQIQALRRQPTLVVGPNRNGEFIDAAGRAYLDKSEQQRRREEEDNRRIQQDWIQQNSRQVGTQEGHPQPWDEQQHQMEQLSRDNQMQGQPPTPPAK
jgi:hypothetical protein